MFWCNHHYQGAHYLSLQSYVGVKTLNIKMHSTPVEIQEYLHNANRILNQYTTIIKI